MSTYETEFFRDKQLGFFIFLGVETIMFLTLFATYFIFTPSTEGPPPSDVFQLGIVLAASVFLITSSGTLFLSEKGLNNKNNKTIVIWLVITLLLGLSFLAIELTEIRNLMADGYTTSTSSFLSAYYVLIGLHGAHVLFGCGWMIVLLIQLLQINIPFTLFIEKFKIFSYYWHFVDIVWIFIVLIVYVRYLF